MIEIVSYKTVNSDNPKDWIISKKVLNNLIELYCDYPKRNNSKNILYKILYIAFELNEIETFKLKHLIRDWDLIDVLNDMFVKIYDIDSWILENQFFRKQTNLIVNTYLNNHSYCTMVFFNKKYSEKFIKNDFEFQFKI